MKNVYRLERHGRLLMTRSFIKGEKGKASPKLLIDTDSAYTIVSQEILEFIGSNPATAQKRQRIITGSGYEIVPLVSCLINNFTQLCHSCESRNPEKTRT